VKPIIEYLSTKISKPIIIKATDETIHKIVKSELDRLGHDADLNHIDVSEVTDMNGLFCCHNDYLGEKYNDLNPNISKWDVSNVKDMSVMFWKCKSFDCDISRFDVSNVTNMKHMFFNCKNFNQDLSQWDVRNVEDMQYMFYECENFNQDISMWNVGNVCDMRSMFWGCKNFNQDLSQWDVRKVKYRFTIFDGCHIKEEFKPKFK